MQNITELRKSLASNYDKMESKKMTLPLGKELANTAGKIINSLKAECEYNTMTNKKETIIDFLEQPKKTDSLKALD